MNPRARMELEAIVSELLAVSRELNDVAIELKEYKGIGTELCSTKLQHISVQYDNIRNSLNRHS